ncbi:MAG: VCBS repeat-containing protein [Thermoplasmata archaeon]|nr:MAG: VCBS repeat-containing protein [Thermoplasmata archaeon]
MRGGKLKIIYNITLITIISICILIPRQIPGDFEYRKDFITGNGPHSAGLADLDNDGDLDIVTADYYGDTISILTNDGEGIYSKTGEYETGDGPRFLFVADLDSDLDMDIATANYGDDSASVFKNHGNGSFATRVDYDVGSGPYSIFLADVGEDANGDLDLITADEQAFKVSVLENDGNGAFSNKMTYRVGTKPKGLYVEDLNGDGFSDIATANWADDSISVLTNKGDGTFEDHVEYDTGDGPRFISISDLNGDDDPDIVCANQHGDSISLLFNQGDGTFASKIDYPVDDNPISVLCIDMDLDEDSDILTTNLANATISVLKNDGLGSFSQRIDYGTDSGPYCVLLGDINSDGEPDMITANNYADTVSIHYSNFPPSIFILQPDGEFDIANTSYTISWEDFAPYTDAIIDLFWDDDNVDFDGTSIVSGLSEDDDSIGGSFAWNITDMPEGDFWIYAKIDDGTYEPRYSYSPGALTINHSIIPNSPPTFQFIEPDGNKDFADTVFTIMWIDSDPDDDASISLYYGVDDSGSAGNLIANGLSEDAHGNSGIYVWNTTHLLEGEYYIFSLSDDGHNEPVEQYSTYPVIVNHSLPTNHTPSTNVTPPNNNPPMIQIIEPDGQEDHANTEYMITWIDSDVDSSALISLYYDTDISGYDGVLIASGISEDEHGNSGIFIWDTSSIPEGQYFIHAIIDDGFEHSRDYSPGSITIDHSGFFNTAPKILILTPEKSIEEAHESFIIRWGDSDPDENAQISLFYDTDQSGHDGVLIVSELSEDDENDFFLWNTSELPEGEYYVYGMITDNVNIPYFDYSQGKLRISHDENGEDDGEKEESTPTNYVIFLVLILLLFLILMFMILRKSKQGEGEDKLDDITFEDHESEEPSIPLQDLEEDEVDEELLPQEEPHKEKVDEEHLQKQEEQQEGKVDEDHLPHQDEPQEEKTDEELQKENVDEEHL